MQFFTGRCQGYSFSVKFTLGCVHNHDCLPILMLLCIMLCMVLAYLVLFAALTNSVCLNNASLFSFFKIFFKYFL